MLIMAIWRRDEPHSLLRHPNQGSQCTSEQFRRLRPTLHLLAEPAWQSLGQRRGGELLHLAQDNCTARDVYCTEDDAKVGVFDYVKRLYNPLAPTPDTGYLSPVDYQDQTGRA